MIFAHNCEQSFDRDDHAAAIEHFNRDGVVILKNAFSRDYVHQLHQHYMEFYHSRIHDPAYPYRIWSLGDRRIHVTLELFKDFNNQDFYANRWAYGFVSSLLGDRAFMLPTFSAAVSFPGADKQYIHRDQPWLFDDVGVNSSLPVTSVTMSLPLVDVDGNVGSTEFQLGSHVPKDLAGMRPREGVQGVEFEQANAETGDCILWDSRLNHRGVENRSNTIRPIILFYYQRTWFFNFENYTAGAALPFTEKVFGGIPSNYVHLFEGVYKLFPRVHYEAERNMPCPCRSGLQFRYCHGVVDLYSVSTRRPEND